MPNKVNQLLLKEYRARFDGVQSLVAIGYEGMPVNAQNKMRNDLADRDTKFIFVKNRLINIAFKEMGLPDVRSICKGQTAFVFGEDPVAVARFLVDAAAESEGKLVIHGGVVEGTVLNSQQIVDLSKSPTKEELKAQIVGQALTPGSKLAGAFVSPASKIASQIKTLIENLEKSA